MKSPLPIALAVAAIAVVALWFAAGSADGPQPDLGEAMPQGNRDLDGATGALRGESAPEHARDLAEPSPGDVMQLDHPHAFTLRVRAIDEFGLPAGGRRVRIAPIGCTQNVMEERTDDLGRATVEWKGRTSSMRMGLALGRGPLREITVASGASMDIVGLVPRDTGGLSFTIVSRGDSKGGFVFGGQGEQTLQLVASTEHEDSVEARIGLHPNARFSDRLLDDAPIAASPAALDALPLIGKLFTSTLDAGPKQNAGSAGTDTRGSITGVVFGADGKPAAQQLVALLGDSEAPLATTRSDASGMYRFEGIREGPARIRAGGQRMGLAEQSVVIGKVGATTANLHLQLGQRIEGKAMAADGNPLRGWIVEYESLDGQWVDRALVRDDGAFTMPNLPGGAARLLLRENSNAVPAAIVASVLPDSGPVTLDLSGEAEPKGAISLRLPERAPRVVEPAPDTASQAARSEPKNDGQVEITFGGATAKDSTIQLGDSFRLSNVAIAGTAGAPTASVSAWQVESGFCFSIPRAEDGSFTCSGLRTGYYRIEVRDIGLGAVDLGQHFIDGRATLDLGTAQLPRPATLRLKGRSQEQRIELYHRRAVCDVRAVQELGQRDTVPLPAGTWILASRTGEDAPTFREVVLQPGIETAVDLTPR